MEFNDLIVTALSKPLTVISPKGKTLYKQNRSAYGLSFCMEGQITYTMDGKTVVSNPSCAVLLPQGGSYTLHCDKAGRFPVISFRCEGFSCTQLRELPITDLNGYLRKYEAMRDAYVLEGNRMKALSLFYSILDRLQQESDDPENSFTEVMEYIRSHISDPNLTNGSIARHVGLSEVWFRKLFTQKYGTSPKQYILEMRLRKAKQLLTETDSTVTVIAEACGFSSLYVFSRCFRERTGLAPTEYARRNRGFII